MAIFKALTDAACLGFMMMAGAATGAMLLSPFVTVGDTSAGIFRMGTAAIAGAIFGGVVWKLR